MTDTNDTKKLLDERFAELPKPVQNAITSADLQKRLRELAETNKLHLDQWEKLENTVLLTLFGATAIDELEGEIEKSVGVPAEVAKTLTENISRIVFQPIREELERELDNPDAKAAAVSDVEQARQQTLAQGAAQRSEVAQPAAQNAAPAVPAVAPATPPAAPNEEKVARAPISESYHAGQPSTERKSVHDDPYRESPL